MREIEPKWPVTVPLSKIILSIIRYYLHPGQRFQWVEKIPHLLDLSTLHTYFSILEKLQNLHKLPRIKYIYIFNSIFCLLSKIKFPRYFHSGKICAFQRNLCSTCVKSRRRINWFAPLAAIIAGANEARRRAIYSSNCEKEIMPRGINGDDLWKSGTNSSTRHESLEPNREIVICEYRYRACFPEHNVIIRVVVYVYNTICNIA